MILVGRIQEYTGDYPTSYYDISRTDTGVCWRSSCSILGYCSRPDTGVYTGDYPTVTRISVGRIQEYT